MKPNNLSLVLQTPEDRDQFIIDNQRVFKYGIYKNVDLLNVSVLFHEKR